MKFTDIQLIQPIQKALQDAGYESPTEIQSRAIPEILEGKDIMGCAQTGTGKTAAFALPILQLLESRSSQKLPRALIMTPTRELALQIQNNFRMYSRFLPLRCEAIYGGVNQFHQVKALKKGLDILIATPGRLLDLIQQGYIHLNKLEVLVLDEADRMLDMGFINDIKRIMSLVPEDRQTLFFSATLPRSIVQFAKTILNDPIQITVSPETKTADTVQQSLYIVEKRKKTSLLKDILTEGKKRKSLIFMRTKHSADKLAQTLSRDGIYAAAIHGNKSQRARQKALNEFKNSRINVLVATDVASRGIDIDELPLVINYDLPNEAETYVHRIGRTGRAGHEGIAISFCAPEEKKELREIQKLIGFKIPVAGRIESSKTEEAEADHSQQPKKQYRQPHSKGKNTNGTERSFRSRENNRKTNFKYNKHRKNARRKSEVL